MQPNPRYINPPLPLRTVDGTLILNPGPARIIGWSETKWLVDLGGWTVEVWK